MGTGGTRSLDCLASGDCPNGPALKQKLLGPKALASAPDGSVYVADYNLIRRITPNGEASTMLKLK